MVIAKVDATEQEGLAKEYDVQGFPTLYWFVKGEHSAYSGGRVENEIVTWVKKKTGPPAQTIADADALEKFKKESSVVGLGVFKDEEQAKGFLAAAQKSDDIPFGIAYDNAAIETAAGVSAPAVVLFKDFEDPKLVFEGDVSDGEAIHKFIIGNQLPLIIPFSQDTAQKVFGGDINEHLLLFIDESKEEDKAKVFAAAKPVAEKVKGEMLVVSIDKVDERVLEFFGIKEEDIPTARIVGNVDEGMTKYKYPLDEVTEEGLTQFVDDFKAGKLTQDLKSEEPLDESEQEDVYVVVGKNFDEVVNRPGVNVMVEFYAPWCGHCKKLEPEYKALAAHYKDNDKVLIAKMDSTANEVASVQIQGFPTIKFFPADSEEIVDFDGERNTEGMKKFIEEQLAK